jgi:hypothetical protein
MTRAGIVALVLVLGTLNAPGGRAQSLSGAPRPAFDVASIKLNKSGDPVGRVGPIGDGRLRVTDMPLQFLITMAYDQKIFSFLERLLGSFRRGTMSRQKPTPRPGSAI